MRGIVALLCALALTKADPVRTNIASFDETDPKQAPVICATDNSDGILIAHENCNQFYQCWDGIPIARICYGNLHYNPTAEICDWPDKVDCGGRLIPQDISANENDNEVSDVDGHGGDGGNGAGNCDPSQAGTICGQEGSDGTFVAHENCNKYYICDNGVPVVQRCPGTLLFDPFKDYCDWPESVDCGVRTICEESEENNSDTENGDNDNNGNVGAGNNCDPSQAGNICASEGSDGVLVAHKNCNKYYICSHGVPTVQRCPGTLLFDPFKDSCDWPESVDCGDRTICEESEENNGDSENAGNDNNGNVGAGNCDPSQAGNICAGEGSDGVLVAHENCNKYYICSHGVPTVQRCPGTLLFDPFKDSCDWPESVDCGDRTICEESEENNGDSENAGNDNNGNVGAGNCDPSQAGNICASEGSDGVLVAHENCNKYYICSHGVPTVQRCPGTLLFDPFKDSCDWPESVDCGDRTICEESEENNGDSENAGNDNNGNVGAGNCDPSQAGNICAGEGSDGILVAHENCNKYYICSHGEPTVQSCPGTLLFDPFKDYCDWPDNVNCDDRVISESSEEDSNETENEDSDNGGSIGTGAGNCDPSQAGNICAAEGSDGVLVAHENCNKYYVCNHGVPTVQRCPGTLLFDPFKDYCDWPDNVNCDDRVISESSEEDSNETENEDSDNGGSIGTGAGNCDPSQAGNICAAEGSDGVLVAHENCNKYYVCNHGVPTVQRCPGTLLFDPFKDYCDWPDNVNCGDRVISESSPEDTNETENGNSDNGGSIGTGAGNCDPSQAENICAAEGSDGVLVAHENCNKYYVCNHGVPTVQRCPGTLLFDPFKDYCDWPDNVNCGDRVISESSPEDTNETENGNSDNGGSIGTGAGNCDPSQAGNICAAEGSDGVLVAHENCNKYYVCNHGVPTVQRCPVPLLFDPFKDYCDWPDNVNCGDRVISESSPEDTNETENGNSDNGGSIGTGAGNCDPSQAENICAAEGSDGVLVAHENCNKYYVCNHGVPTVQRCPGTLLFDPFKDYCDWPENVDCGDRVIPENESKEEINESGNNENNDIEHDKSENDDSATCNCNPAEAPGICAMDGSGGTFIAHEICNRFYICVSGKPVAMVCPSHTLFNPYTQLCDWSDKVDCGERVIQDSEEDHNDNENQGDGNSDTEHDTDNGGSGTCNCNPGEAPAICAADGSENTLVAHENCNQFYTCAAGQPVTLTCPGSTLYNPYTEQCDWPENVECGKRVIPEVNSEENDSGNGETDTDNTEDEGSDNGSTDNEGSETCYCNPGEAPAICAVDGSDGTFIAHENCNQFYTCVAGKPATVTCPASTLYNPYTQQCDWPENVECGDRVIPEVDDNKNVESEKDSSENGDSDNSGSDNGGSGTCNCSPGEAPAICAVDGSDGTFIAHENCNQFYTCVAGKPATVTCPASTLYNPYTQQCDWPENVECGDRVISEVDDSKNVESEKDSSEIGDLDNGGSDNGGSDNGGSGTCNCSPGEAPAICAVDGSDGTFISHENCNQFYTCVAGKPATVTCPASTLYNPYTQQCDWPENVECGDRVIPEVDDNKNVESEKDSSENGDSDNGGSDNGGSDNGGSENGGSENGGSDNGGSGTCNCSPGEAPAICAVDGSDGTFIAHENCNQFYTCVAGKPATVTCPASTLYNPYTQQCDWPENVECGDRVISEVDDNKNVESEKDSSENGDSDNGGSDNGGSGTCNCSPGEAPAICAVDGSDGTFIAHENCNQFYTCVAGKPATVTCPASTLYNPYTQQCDWPENVECGDRVIPEVDDSKNVESEKDSSENGDSDNGGSDNGGSDNGGSENGGSDNGGSDNGGSGTCNCSPGEAPAICAVDGSDGTFIAHENCNQFYTCVAGKPATVTCPASTLYNPYTQQCDWPENVECGNRVIPEVDDNKNVESEKDSSENGDSENGGPDNGGSGTCNCSPGEAPAICAVDGSDGTFIAHENCNQFYTCVAGKPATVTCPASTLYNPYTQQCDWPENVECGDRVIPEVDDSKNEESEKDSSENGDSDNGGSDNGGSDNGGSENGGSDNGGSGTCNCSPGEAPAICAVDGSDGTFIAHENCNQFYTCVAGKPATVTCPASTLYNPYTQQCDWPENVECGDRVIPEVDDSKNEESEKDSSENGDSDNGGSDNGGSDNGGSENGGSDNGGSGTCNCSPGEAPAICAVDGSDGTFIAHENCNQFYTCVAGKPATVTCPASTLYNPYTQQCDWPENVECGDRVIPEEDDNKNVESEKDSSENGDSDNGGSDNGGSGTCNCSPGEAPAICAVDGSDGTFIAHENCNQFYTCVAGKPATVTCPASTLYNPYTQQCDWPENVECGDRVIPEVDDSKNVESEKDSSENGDSDNGGSDNGGSDNGGSENGGSENGGSDNGGSCTCNCSPGEAPAICAVDGSDGTFIAHENCNQFYTCVAGKPATVTCPASTLYNPYTQQCDWPENVECGDRVIPEVDDSKNEESEKDSSENGDSDNGGSDNGGSGTCNCSPGEAPAICAVDGSDGTFIAHENCNQFYTCVAGKPATVTCPASTLYNPYTQQCDWPENVECGDRVIPEVDDNKNVESEKDSSENGDSDNGGSENGGSDNGGSENGGSDNGGSGTCNCSPGEAPAICAVDGSDGTFIAHENCNQFYTCVAGKPATVTCPASTLYNPYTQQCDWPENVKCGDRVIPEVDDNENVESEKDSSENGDTDNGGSDNGGSGTCNCSPGEAPVICAVDGSDGTFIAHENCNQFYTCVAGKPATVTCPASTLYNPYTQQCDWPENVECGERIIPEIDCEEDDNGNEETGTDSSESDNSDDSESDNGGSGSCNCNPDEAPAICAADESDGILVAHKNCNQFYTCATGQPATLTCPGSTLYNPYTQRCDWPEKVECGERTIPELECEDDNSTNEGGEYESGSDNGGSDNGDSSESGDFDNSSFENGDNGGSDNGNSSENGDLDNVSSENGDSASENSSESGDSDNNGSENGDDSDNGNSSESGELDESADDNNTNEENDNEDTESASLENDDNNISAPDSENSDNEETDIESSDSCKYCNPIEAPAICATYGSDGIMVAHENCNQFYTCFAGQPVTLTCTGNTLYNPSTQRCDWPDNVICGDNTNSENENTENEISESETNDSEDLGNDPDVMITCANPDSEGLFLPHEICNQFYVCIGNQPVIISCSGNLLYNLNEKRCDWPANVNCESRIISNDSSEALDAEADDIRIVDVQDDNNEEPETEQEDQSGIGYDAAVKRCADGNSAGAMVPHEECHRFYICVAQRPVVFTCTSDNLYDTEKQQCNYPQDVNCGGRVLRTV